MIKYATLPLEEYIQLNTIMLYIAAVIHWALDTIAMQQYLFVCLLFLLLLFSLTYILIYKQLFFRANLLSIINSM